MGFFDELKGVALAGAQGAVKDATGAAVASGETAFKTQTGISVAQPLPPAGAGALAPGSSTASPPSPISQDAVAAGGGFKVNKTVLVIAGVALIALVIMRSKGR